MRLFTGIAIEPFVIPRLTNPEFLKGLSATPHRKLHITTKFIGEWPEAKLPVLEEALAGIVPEGPVRIQIEGMARFEIATVALVVPGRGLMRLAEATRKAVEAIGCPIELQPYEPHVTLGRENVKHLPALIGTKRYESGDPFFGDFEAKSFHLYLSKAGEYTIIRTYPTC